MHYEDLAALVLKEVRNVIEKEVDKRRLIAMWHSYFKCYTLCQNPDDKKRIAKAAMRLPTENISSHIVEELSRASQQA